MDIQDKEYRKALIERYLDADTTPAEERLLRVYYTAAKDLDDDEKAIARLLNILAPSEQTYSQTNVD